MNPYATFWQFLPYLLLAADLRTGKNLFLPAVKRLKRIEEGGNGGYLNNNDPFQALADYVAHVYDGAAVPFWLMSAERG